MLPWHDVIYHETYVAEVKHRGMGIVYGWGTELVDTKGQNFFFQFFVSILYFNFYVKKII